jgi:hypothetical protein
MAGSLTIKVTPGCDADEVVMTLSSTAEPNGGDHTAVVNWRGENNQLAGLVDVSYEISPGTWITAPNSFLFTSAGETYTLRARGVEHLAEYNLELLFPYRVSAAYAPYWASVEDLLVASVDDSPCCTPVGELAAYQAVVPGINNAAGSYYTTSGDCTTIDASAPATVFQACSTTNYTWGPTTWTPSYSVQQSVYEWLSKGFSISYSNTITATCDAVTGTAVVNLTISKTAGEAHCTVHMTKIAFVTGTKTTTSACYAAPDAVIADLSIPCSAFVFHVYHSGDLTANAPGSIALMNNYTAVDFRNPP